MTTTTDKSNITDKSDINSISTGTYIYKGQTPDVKYTTATNLNKNEVKE